MNAKKLIATPRKSFERKLIINEIKQDIIEQHYKDTGFKVQYDTERLNGIIDDLQSCGQDMFQAEIVVQELEDLLKGVE